MLNISHFLFLYVYQEMITIFILKANQEMTHYVLLKHKLNLLIFLIILHVNYLECVQLFFYRQPNLNISLHQNIFLPLLNSHFVINKLIFFQKLLSLLILIFKNQKMEIEVFIVLF